jgi:hypothetical protein
MEDGTIDAFPDVLTVAFGDPAPIGRIRLHTLDSAQYPAGAFGIEDVDLQLPTGGEWRTVAAIRDSDRGVVEASFPPLDADAVQRRGPRRTRLVLAGDRAGRDDVCQSISRFASQLTATRQVSRPNAISTARWIRSAPGWKPKTACRTSCTRW